MPTVYGILLLVMLLSMMTALGAQTVAPSNVTDSPTQVSLSSTFNRTGSYTDGSAFELRGGLDLHGNAYSANLLGTSEAINGIPFTLGPANAPDAVANATIPLPAGQYGALAMLGVGVNGNQANQKFTVTYTDGTTSMFNQSMSDWRTTQAYQGESQAVTMPNRNVYNKTKKIATYYVYGYSFALNTAKTVQNIVLPANANVTVLALTLVPSTVLPIPSMNPGTVTLSASGTQQFTASNLGTNPTWSVFPTTATLSAGGLYTAPNLVLSPSTITVTATSATDLRRAVSATITLNALPPPPIAMPIEVMGSDGTTESTSFSIPTGTSLSGLTLSLQIHGLRYQSQASFQLNNSAWLPINDSIMKYVGMGGIYGGIGGGFNTLEMTTPVPFGSLQAGTNILSFRFNASNGVSSGFRVLAFKIQDGSGAPVMSSASFVQTDPDTWQPPLPNTSDIGVGQMLWHSAQLTVPMMSASVPINAHCADCHAQDGRDLKYFNYSNNSIQARSRFHGLSEQQGMQIASYIRSLDVPNPGRPWNPPYQPGPGMDSQPRENWAAGAGLEAVLASDAEMQPYIMPGGSTASWAANQYLNPREIPIALQLPDWNSWLPVVHPMDGFGASFTNSGFNTLYSNIRNGLHPNDPVSYSNQLGGFHKWFIAGDQTFLVPIETNANWDADNLRTKVYSAALWQMVKLWELNQEYGLEAMPQVPFGAKANPRGWYGAIAFATSPNMLHITTGPGIGNGTDVSRKYLSYIWYHMQLILNDGQGQQVSHNPFDFGYVYGVFMNLSLAANNTPGAMVQLLWYVKALQEETLTGTGPELGTDRGFAASWTTPQVLVDYSWRSLWTATSPSTRAELTEAAVQAWFAQIQTFSPQQFYTGGWAKATDDPAKLYFETSFGGQIWFALPRLRFYGVDPNLTFQISAWAAKIWPQGNWTFNNTATCDAFSTCTSGY